LTTNLDIKTVYKRFGNIIRKSQKIK